MGSPLKPPAFLPQDIQLIQDLVDLLPRVSTFPAVSATLQNDPSQPDDDIASSGDETNSEDEVEANILVDNDETLLGMEDDWYVL